MNNKINIDDIYTKIIVNKIISKEMNNQQNNKFQQGSDILNLSNTNNNFINDLMNSLKSDSIEFKSDSVKSKSDSIEFKSDSVKSKSDSVKSNYIELKSDSVEFKSYLNDSNFNTFLYNLSYTINIDINSIKENIKIHLDNDDILCLKDKFNNYKQCIQLIRKFLIEDKSDLEISDSLLYYICYLYNIILVIHNEKIYKIFNVPCILENQSIIIENLNNPTKILILSKNKTQYKFEKIIKNDQQNLVTYTENLLLYKTISELNKLKIKEIKDICQKLNIDTKEIKSTLISSINKIYETL
jgi:hypothetical protein